MWTGWPSEWPKIKIPPAKKNVNAIRTDGRETRIKCWNEVRYKILYFGSESVLFSEFPSLKQGGSYFVLNPVLDGSIVGQVEQMLS